jgi:putative ABC transport system permease protein
MGRDVKMNFNKNLDLIGGVTILRTYFDNERDRTARRLWFQPQTVAALKKIPGVQEVSLVGFRGAAAMRHKHQYQFMVVAVDENFWSVRSFWPQHGTLFSPEAVRHRERVCTLGATLARKIFGHDQVVGASLEIEHDLYRVTGVVGGLADTSLADFAFVPLTTAQDRFTGPTLADRVYLRARTWDDVPTVAAAIPRTVQDHQPADNLVVYVSWDALRHVQKVAFWLEFLVYLGVLATLTLGGVGIWVVMMAAVRTRTREIGLKKAMGAEDRDILAQFLTESLCLSLGSALLGIGLGRLLVELTSSWVGIRPSEELFLACLALGLAFALVVGVGAGLYPSVQASRMEVVAATRYE